MKVWKTAVKRTCYRVCTTAKPERFALWPFTENVCQPRLIKHISVAVDWLSRVAY